MTEAWYRLPSGMYPLDWVITESMLNIRPKAPALQTDPASLNFYGAPGQDSDSQLLRIQANVDGVQVNSISSPAGFVIALADEFSDHLASLPVLQAQQKLSILVQFRPQQAGGYYGTLAIHYNDDSVRYVILRGWSFDGRDGGPGRQRLRDLVPGQVALFRERRYPGAAERRARRSSRASRSSSPGPTA